MVTIKAVNLILNPLRTCRRQILPAGFPLFACHIGLRKPKSVRVSQSVIGRFYGGSFDQSRGLVSSMGTSP